MEESIFERFRDGFIEGAKKVVVGNGLDAATQILPRDFSTIAQFEHSAIQTHAEQSPSAVTFSGAQVRMSSCDVAPDMG